MDLAFRAITASIPARQSEAKQQESRDQCADTQHKPILVRKDIGCGERIEQALHGHLPAGSYPKFGLSHFSTSLRATPFRRA